MEQLSFFDTKPSAPVYVDILFAMQSKNSHARRVGERHGHQWCHMWSSDVDALHRLADKLGLKREWFQDKPRFPHYDLVPTKRVLAIQHGAVEKSLREWLEERKRAEKTA